MENLYITQHGELENGNHHKDTTNIAFMTLIYLDVGQVRYIVPAL